MNISTSINDQKLLHSLMQHLGKEDIAGIQGDISRLQAKMETRLSDSKTEILRWMLTLFMVTMLALIGLYFKI